ncbi:hypothetical protein [Novosphingobium aquimarinum]|uniref:hypothetical protein n=1 Tax=Novosphingobium aquimarinum TaxID=2682494 RepID=UPI0012EB68F4|nr:hypothetical protein [Novosphingobium aquimarinum]
MTDKENAKLGEGGALQKRSVDDKSEDPGLQKESRQAVKNQSKVKPGDYPDRDQNPV